MPSHDSVQLEASVHPGATQPLPASPVAQVPPAREQSYVKPWSLWSQVVSEAVPLHELPPGLAHVLPFGAQDRPTDAPGSQVESTAVQFNPMPWPLTHSMAWLFEHWTPPPSTSVQEGTTTQSARESPKSSVYWMHVPPCFVQLVARPGKKLGLQSKATLFVSQKLAKPGHSSSVENRSPWQLYQPVQSEIVERQA